VKYQVAERTTPRRVAFGGWYDNSVLRGGHNFSAERLLYRK
jgi:hypothetical protein